MIGAVEAVPATLRTLLPWRRARMGYQTAFVTLLGMFLADESATPSFADGLMISRYMQALASAAEHGVPRNTL
jgi:hypothetical protein